MAVNKDPKQKFTPTDVEASVNLMSKALDKNQLKQIEKGASAIRYASKELAKIDTATTEKLKNLAVSLQNLTDPNAVQQFDKSLTEIRKITSKIIAIGSVSTYDNIAKLSNSIENLSDIDQIKLLKGGLNELMKSITKIKYINSVGGRAIEALANSMDRITNKDLLKRFDKGLTRLYPMLPKLKLIGKASSAAVLQLGKAIELFSDLKAIAKFRYGFSIVKSKFKEITDLDQKGSEALFHLGESIHKLTDPVAIAKFSLGIKLIRKLIVKDLTELKGISAEVLKDISDSMLNISDPIKVAKFTLGIKAIRHVMLGDIVEINKVSMSALKDIALAMETISKPLTVLKFKWGIDQIIDQIEELQAIGGSGAGSEVKAIGESLENFSNPIKVVAFSLGIKAVSASIKELAKLNHLFLDKDKLNIIGELIGKMTLKGGAGIAGGSKAIMVAKDSIESLGTIDTKGLEFFAELSVKWKSMWMLSRTIKKFPDENKLKKFTTNLLTLRPVLEEYSGLKSAGYGLSLSILARGVKKLSNVNVKKFTKNLREIHGQKSLLEDLPYLKLAAATMGAGGGVVSKLINTSIGVGGAAAKAGIGVGGAAAKAGLNIAGGVGGSGTFNKLLKGGIGVGEKAAKVGLGLGGTVANKGLGGLTPNISGLISKVGSRSDVMGDVSSLEREGLSRKASKTAELTLVEVRQNQNILRQVKAIVAAGLGGAGGAAAGLGGTGGAADAKKDEEGGFDIDMGDIASVASIVGGGGATAAGAAKLTKMQKAAKLAKRIPGVNKVVSAVRAPQVTSMVNKLATPAKSKGLFSFGKRMLSKLNPLNAIKAGKGKIFTVIKNVFKKSKFLFKGLPIIGPLISLATMSLTAKEAYDMHQSGSSPRQIAMKIIPEAVGAIGSVLGTALGTVGGPLGMAIGGIGGSYAVGKIFEMWGDSLTPMIADALGFTEAADATNAEKLANKAKINTTAGASAGVAGLGAAANAQYTGSPADLASQQSIKMSGSTTGGGDSSGIMNELARLRQQISTLISAVAAGSGKGGGILPISSSDKSSAGHQMWNTAYQQGF